MVFPEIETGRLRLAVARPGLEEPLARFYAENFAGHLDRWSPPPPENGFGADHWARRLPEFEKEFEAGSAVRWVMLSRAACTPEVLGTCNFTQIARGPFRACVLGYQVARSHQGRGLMHEALSETLDYAFRELRLHRVMANYRPENTRSARLLDRLGFAREGYARRYLFIDGAWRDHILTSKTNPHFDAAWLRDWQVEAVGTGLRDTIPDAPVFAPGGANGISQDCVPNMSKLNENAPVAARPYDAALEREIAALIVSALNLEIGPEDIDPEARLYQEGLGLDSIDILEVALVVSKRYGFKLRDDGQDNEQVFRSLRSLAATVAERRTN